MLVMHVMCVLLCVNKLFYSILLYYMAPALSWLFCHVPLTGTISNKYFFLVVVTWKELTKTVMIISKWSPWFKQKYFSASRVNLVTVSNVICWKIKYIYEVNTILTSTHNVCVNQTINYALKKWETFRRHIAFWCTATFADSLSINNDNNKLLN